MYYDRHGNAISLEEWLRLSGNDFYKLLAFTHLWGSRLVLTVWRGHTSESGPRSLFQTAVFRHAQDGEPGSAIFDEEGPHWVMDKAWETLAHPNQQMALLGHQTTCNEVCRCLGSCDKETS